MKEAQLSRYVEHRDPLEFLLHDLKHMENFVGKVGKCKFGKLGDTGLYYEQVGLL